VGLQLSAEGQTKRNQLITNAMTTKEFLEKYPMVLESDVNQLTSHVRLEMISYYEDLEDPNYHPEDDQEEDYDDDYASFNDSILNQSRFYIIASTSFYMSETYYFPSTDGVNHTSEELGCSMALRWGDNEFDNGDEISGRLSEHFPGYLIEKKDTFNLDTDMGLVVKRVYSLSKLA
jgi:hypothetical protein